MTIRDFFVAGFIGQVTACMILKIALEKLFQYLVNVDRGSVVIP